VSNLPPDYGITIIQILSNQKFEIKIDKLLKLLGTYVCMIIIETFIKMKMQ
jgi:hypothetical protein